MQKTAAEIQLPEGSVLAIIEDATGAGKTEAATLLAHRMMAMGKAAGLYFALPTMATANAMFARMEKAYINLYAPGETPSLALAHGKAALSDAFSEVKLAAIAQPGHLAKGDEETSALCAAWIGDDRRKTFFAEVGVGTIDQALLAVLPSKFQSLRLWGLANRIIIIDEAHAYDAYMSKELETLLEFHATLGGSAIILSATLPGKKRADLVNAFAKGLGVSHKCTAAHEAPYPLLTVASADAVIETGKGEIEPAGHTVRKVYAERLGDEQEAVTRIKAAVDAGAAVAWVRNAVDDAIAAVELLRDAGIEADLFHARFAMGDRLAIEQAQVDRFGKDGTAEERRGRVLVATQVIEQSLDLDFDMVVSDLAPIDLLIQRAGRLWRHMDLRPADKRPVAGPKLLVLSPDPGKVETKNWLQDFGHKGAYVYSNHALLWRTAKVLFDNRQVDGDGGGGGGGWRAPDDLRPLIEKVYGEGSDLATPAVLQQKDIEAYGNDMGERSMAGFLLLKLSDGYADQGSWLEETLAKTRLGEPTLTLRLARIDDADVVPCCSASKGRDSNRQDDSRAWALSEITVRESWLAGADVAANWRDAINVQRNCWPKWQRDMLVAIVDDEGRLLLDWPAESERALHYDRIRGLVTS